MISVGSGNRGVREPNQLQAVKQANVISTKTFNLYAHALLRKHERIMQRRYQLLINCGYNAASSVRRLNLEVDHANQKRTPRNRLLSR
jgi:hypothetical protein